MSVYNQLGFNQIQSTICLVSVRFLNDTDISMHKKKYIGFIKIASIFIQFSNNQILFVTKLKSGSYNHTMWHYFKLL